VSSVADIAIASTLAVGGIGMTPLPPLVLVGALAAAIAFAVILDLVKVPIFDRLKLSSPLSQSLLVPITLPAPRAPVAHGWSRTVRLKPFLLLLGLMMAASGGGYKLLERSKTAMPIGVASGHGRIAADEIDIDTKFGGRVADLLVDEGAVVTAGQILAHIDTRDLDALLKRDEARVLDLQKVTDENAAHIARTVIRIKRANQHFDRTRRLLRKGRATSKMLDHRRQAMNGAIAALTVLNAKMDEARVNLDAAKQAVGRDQVNIADSTIHAPRGGRIQHRIANVGELLPPGAKVFVMLDTASIYMDIYLPGGDSEKVKIGTDARIVLDDLPNLSFSAKVSFLAAEAPFAPTEVESKTQRDKLMFRVRVLIDPARLGAGAVSVRTGSPGVAYVRLNPQVAWPPQLP
ncbi:MAG: HlyD family efflux transporter periplasmic adaptor subunit, partial [Methylocella sp.]